MRVKEYAGVPFEKLRKMSDDELLEIGIKRDKHGKLRNLKGHYIPGEQGTVMAKDPKKSLAREKREAKNELAIAMTKSELITEEMRAIYGSDSKKALEVLLASSRTRSEVIRICKDLLPYQHDKAAEVVNQFNFESANFKVKWKTDEEEPVVIENEDNNTD